MQFDTPNLLARESRILLSLYLQKEVGGDHVERQTEFQHNDDFIKLSNQYEFIILFNFHVQMVCSRISKYNFIGQ